MAKTELLASGAAEVVKTVAKALDIIEFVGNCGTTPLPQISKSLRINRSTAYRILQTLQSRGYIRRDETAPGYELGYKLIPLATRVLDSSRLRTRSLPYLESLAQKSGHRVNLGILFNGEVLYLGGIEKPTLPSVYTLFGKTAPAHCCSLGKVILAHLPEDEVEALLQAHPLTRMTDNTITDTDLFRANIKETRARGYAIDNAEHVAGSYCIAALIRDAAGRGVGSISISAESLTEIEEHKGDLLHTAEIVSHIVGLDG